jgi:dienelactone hydrolase
VIGAAGSVTVEVARRRPVRVAVAGFSDGAPYALGLGLANGGLLRTTVAFSPAFVPRGTPREGTPPVFLAHGGADDILPIDRTSRPIVPALRDDGYEVTYRELPGPHTVPVSATSRSPAGRTRTVRPAPPSEPASGRQVRTPGAAARVVLRCLTGAGPV